MSAGKAILIGGIAFGVAAFLITRSRQARRACNEAMAGGLGAAAQLDDRHDPSGHRKPHGPHAHDHAMGSNGRRLGPRRGPWILVQNAGNPLGDWVVFFAGGTGPTPGSPVGIVQSSGSKNAGLIAQAVAAGLIE